MRNGISRARGFSSRGACVLAIALAASGASRPGGDAGAGATGGSTPDGSGALVATLLRAAHANDFRFGGTVSPFVWVTSRDLTSCDFAAVIDVAPGAVNRWTFTAEHATLASDQTCSDVTDWSEVPLCTITGPSRNCRAGDVAMDVAGPACLRGRAVVAPGDNVGPDGAGSGGVASFHCRDAGGDGPTHFQGTGSTIVTGGAFFAGNVVRSPNHERAFFLNAGAPLAVCGGVVGVPVAPGRDDRWQIRLAASTSALTADRNCIDLEYTTTPELCTIAGSSKHCSFEPAAISVPAGGCFQIRAKCIGGDCRMESRMAPNYGLDCSTEGRSPWSAGGPAYQSAGSGAFDANHSFDAGPWGISDARAAASRFSQQYWIAPPSGLAGCGGALTFLEPIRGSGRYGLGLRVGTAPAEGESCLDVAYTDTTDLCSIAAGNKSCRFTAAAADVPGGACFSLFVTAHGKPVARQGNEFNWQAVCTAK